MRSARSISRTVLVRNRPARNTPPFLIASQPAMRPGPLTHYVRTSPAASTTSRSPSCICWHGLIPASITRRNGMDVAVSKARPTLWAAGDMNAFFGLFTNVLLNVLVLSSLCLGVAKLPNDLVFGRILPALGIALPIGNLYYAWLAYRRGMADGRNDVAALPYGPSVPQMFIVTFVVMLPTYIATNDAILGWKLGLIWAMIVGLITLCGILVGPAIRKYTPRAAMLGTLAGVSIAFISMRPAFLIF